MKPAAAAQVDRVPIERGSQVQVSVWCQDVCCNRVTTVPTPFTGHTVRLHPFKLNAGLTW